MYCVHYWVTTWLGNVIPAGFCGIVHCKLICWQIALERERRRFTASHKLIRIWMVKSLVWESVEKSFLFYEICKSKNLRVVDKLSHAKMRKQSYILKFNNEYYTRFLKLKFLLAQPNHHLYRHLYIFCKSLFIRFVAPNVGRFLYCFNKSSARDPKSLLIELQIIIQCLTTFLWVAYFYLHYWPSDKFHFSSSVADMYIKDGCLMPKSISQTRNLQTKGLMNPKD